MSVCTIIVEEDSDGGNGITTTSSVVVIITTAFSVCGPSAFMGPAAYLSILAIQVAQSTVLIHDANDMTEHLLTNDYIPFGLNYDFLTKISDKTFRVDRRRQLSFDSDRFTSYGMKSFVFLYVLLYKSVFLIGGMFLLLATFAAVRLV